MASESNIGLGSYQQRRAQLADNYMSFDDAVALIRAKRRRTDSPNTELEDEFGIGELLESSTCLNVYTWNLDKFSERNCLRRGRLGTTSPGITFAASKWHFSLFPLNFSGAESFGLRLVLEENNMNHQQVYWRLSLKRRFDNTTVKSTDGVHVFGSDPSMACGFVIEDSEINLEGVCLEDCLSVTCEFRLIEDQADANNETDMIPKAGKLSDDFMQLLLSGDASDATFQVKEKNFKVHRAILGARVPAFASMFKHDMSEKISGVVKIEDCEPGIFFIFLTYVYSGTASGICNKSVVSIYKLADKYQLDDLKTVCLEIIKRNFSAKSVCNIIALALQHSDTALLNLTTDFFMKNVKSIIVTAEWQSFLCDYPVHANDLIIRVFGVTKP